MLKFLSEQSSFILLMIFLAENAIVTLIALATGWLILKRSGKAITAPSKQEILLCIVTNVINTLVTYAGFWLWQNSVVNFSFSINWQILTDFVLLFIAMDLAMYIFHYFIHRTIAYKLIHKLHHVYTEPKPIDLFVLHPLETVSFGALWLILLYPYPFNFFAVLIYLFANVLFGIVGHLGTEPLPKSLRNKFLFKYLGSSTFHHNHHTDVNHNFGFYTNIWDRLFKTYKP